MIMKKFLSALVLGIILASCGGNKDARPMQEYVSAFLNENEKVVVFGEVRTMSLLTKAEYKSIPKLGLLLDGELKGIRTKLNMESPVYFALEGPFAEDGTPSLSYGFMEVNNTDSLEADLMQRGFEMEKDGDLLLHQSGDVSFGIRKNLMIIASKKGGFETSEVITAAFKRTQGDLSGGKVDEILSSQKDLVLGVSIQNLYGTSSTDLQSLSKDKQEKLQKMVSDSYVMSTMSMDAGALLFETKNMFSKELADRMFFKEDGAASIMTFLGAGKPRIGLSVNLDMAKMQGFMDEFSPNALSDLAESMGGPAQFALMAAGDDGLAGLLSGQLGFVLVGESFGGEYMVPDFNFHLGLKPAANPMAEMAKTFLSRGMAMIELDDKGLTGATNKQYISTDGKRIQLPEGCGDFGKKGISAFAYLDGMDLESFDLEGPQKLVYLVKYATFEMDNNGSRLRLVAKDGKENILKQMVGLMVDEFEDAIAGM
jgi:hypothetical protein